MLHTCHQEKKYMALVKISCVSFFHQTKPIAVGKVTHLLANQPTNLASYKLYVCALLACKYMVQVHFSTETFVNKATKHFSQSDCMFYTLASDTVVVRQSVINLEHAIQVWVEHGRFKSN